MGKTTLKKSVAVGIILLCIGASGIGTITAAKKASEPKSSDRTWSDNFDSYTNNQLLDGTPDDGGWKGWDNNTGGAGIVTDVISRSAPNANQIWYNSDNVHEYSGYTSGQWVYTAWQFVPDNFSGITYFILLSDYIDGGGSTQDKWQVQLHFDSDLMLVESEFDAVDLPLIKNQWVEIRVEIDLTNDDMKIFYGGSMLIEKAWTAGVNNDGSGILNIAAVDLYANQTSPVYYDDMSLVPLETALTCDTGGPYTGMADEPVQFLGTAYGGTKPYTWAWTFGDGGTADNQTPTHIYTNRGLYNVTLTVTDANMTIASSQTTASILARPSTPVLTGPSSGKVGTNYHFLITSTDPDGNDLYYYINWGDGSNSGWIGPNPSGTVVNVSHTWSELGSFNITALAKNTDGNQSNPSAPHLITITFAFTSATLIGGFMMYQEAPEQHLASIMPFYGLFIQSNPFSFKLYLPGMPMVGFIIDTSTPHGWLLPGVFSFRGYPVGLVFGRFDVIVLQY